MRLLDRTGEIAERWTFVEGDDPVPNDLAPGGPVSDGAVILPYARLGEALLLAAERPGKTGLHLENDVDPRPLAEHFGVLSLISVAFPSFADGRGFSIGRRLRDLGYEGRLRATGPVIADQFAYLLECGFDEVWLPAAVANRQPVESWLAQLSKVNLSYQRGQGATGQGERRRSILDRRRQAGDAQTGGAQASP
ncbi:MAG: DUF934 domain-containing protein [Pseudomonadota bacterium]